MSRPSLSGPVQADLVALEAEHECATRLLDRGERGQHHRRGPAAAGAPGEQVGRRIPARAADGDVQPAHAGVGPVGGPAIGPVSSPASLPLQNMPAGSGWLELAFA
ncbi:hypothetical protein [Streptomyces mexicanus]|uniref:hypothetical protein n=1 Tax=Streptomyces mexicanus TaxID=178566 RepID=UPI00368D44B1